MGFYQLGELLKLKYSSMQCHKLIKMLPRGMLWLTVTVITVELRMLFVGFVKCLRVILFLGLQLLLGWIVMERVIKRLFFAEHGGFFLC
jgi:hypothetical protein